MSAKAVLSGGSPADGLGAHHGDHRVAHDIVTAASIEIGARHAKAISELQAHFARGSEVFITHLPRQRATETIAAAAALRQAGYVPVPHVAARSLQSLGAFDALIAGLHEAAAVDRILAVGGDVDQPAGPFASVMDLIETEVLQARGITALAFAGHPEGHPRMPTEVLERALLAKVVAAHARGLLPSVVTQFCFQSAPILDWLGRVQRLGVAVPVAVGLAGPAELKTLAAFALRCGIGNSARVLRRRVGVFGRLIGHNSVDRIALDIARAAASGAAPMVTRFHVFPFGGIARAGLWRTAMIARLGAR